MQAHTEANPHSLEARLERRNSKSYTFQKMSCTNLLQITHADILHSKTSHNDHEEDM